MTKKEQLELLQRYAQQPAFFTYGIDDLLLILNISSLDELQLNTQQLGYIQKIRNKRLYFLRSRLTDPNISASQIKAIEIALNMIAVEEKSTEEQVVQLIEFKEGEF